MSKFKPLRAAIVGCGRVSVFHIAAIKELPDVNLVAVCDLDEATARKTALQNRINYVYTDIETMLKEVRPDVVHLLTPPHSHPTLAKIAARYGANIYIEKPMACSEEEASVILEAANASGIQICPGHSRLFDPPFLNVCQRIYRGEIGRIISVHAEQGFTYEAAARSAVIPWSYTYDWGIFENLLPHPLSVVCYFLEEPGLPQVVGFNIGRIREAAVEEIRVLIPGKNAIGEISLSLCNSPEVNRVEVVGTRGRIVVDFNTMSVVSNCQSGLPSALSRFTSNLSIAGQLTRSSLAVASGIVTGKVKRYMGLRNLVARFYQSLQEGESSPVRAADGLLNARLIDQIKSACHNVVKARVKEKVNEGISPLPRYLVTGASGFLGGRLIEVLSNRGMTTRATTRLFARASPLPGIEWMQCDLADEAELRNALSGVETVFHCAALAGPPGSLEQYEDINVKGTIRLARLAAEAGVKNLIYISSISVYGFPADSSLYLDENTPYDDRADERGAYTQTKLAAEKALLEFVKECQALRVIVLRPGTIYGPGAQLPIGRLKLPSSNSRPIIAGGPQVPMPLTYVDNLIEAMLRALQNEQQTGSVYNVIDSPECNQGEVVRALRSISGDRIRPYFLPYSIVWMMMLGIDLFSLFRQGKMGTARYRFRRTLANMRYRCTAAREELKWNPHVSLSEGLARVVEYSMEIPKRVVPHYLHETQVAAVEEKVVADGASFTASREAYRARHEAVQ